jgi:hypothetical protein
MDPEALQGALVAETNDNSIWKGMRVLLLSWFIMPFKTLRVSARQLRELGAAGALDISGETPHLSWVRVAGGAVASLAIVAALVGGIGKGLASLGDFQYSPGLSIGGFVLYPLLGLIFAVLVDWSIMMSVEVLGLCLGLAKDAHRMASRP